MDRRVILATIAIAATAGGIALNPDAKTEEAEEAVAEGVEASDQLMVVVKWHPTYSVESGNLKIDRQQRLVALDEQGVEQNFLEGELSDTNIYTPCQVVIGKDNCAQAGADCVRAEEWDDREGALINGGVTLPSVSSCRAQR
jgi:hypothetical protein